MKFLYSDHKTMSFVQVISLTANCWERSMKKRVSKTLGRGGQIALLICSDL